MHNLLPYRKAAEKISLKEKVGQLFMPAAFINDTEEEIQKLESLIGEQGVGSICFFHSRASAATNFEGPKKVVRNENSIDTLHNLIKRYQQAAEHPLLIAIDAEWGLAMRIENTPQYPYAITLGAITDEQSDLIFEVGRNIAKDCRAIGIHWNLAPCVDINNNPHNPVIGYRSFGDDKHSVIQKASAFIRGTQSEGVLTSIKHFPGHGDTATDSHLALPLIDKSKSDLMENELYPFQQLIHEGVDSVMAGHLSVPTLADGNSISSSLSKEIINGVLRVEMGFQGVVISDALNMHAIAKNYLIKGELEWLAFDAGNDILCFAEHVTEGIESILKNASETQIEASFERIWKLKEKVFSPEIIQHDSTESKNEKYQLQNPDNLNMKLAKVSLTLLQGREKIISDFRASDFIGITISASTKNHFFESVSKNKKIKLFNTGDEFTGKAENILLAIFPPQVKPTQNFGFAEEELIFMNELIQTKNVVLYLFGNPYVLNHIDFKKAKAVVMAYQNFEVFQEMAADHFLGKFKAKGKLPVQLA